MSKQRHRWLYLILGFAAIALFVGLLHLGSVHLNAAMIEENRNKDLEVYAYVYSEVTDLEEFLDDQKGKYGRAALIEAINHAEQIHPK